MELRDLLFGLNKLTVAIVVIAALVGGVRYPRLSSGQRRLAWLAGFEAVLELVFLYFFYTGHNNLFLHPVVLAGEMVLVGLLYQQVLQSAAFTRAVPWLIGVAVAGVLVETGVRWGTLRFFIGSQLVGDLLALLLAGLYFQKLLNELHVKNLSAEPFFWVSAALAVHGLGDLLIALFSNYIQANYSRALQQIILYGVSNGLNACLYATYCLALWMRPPKLSS